MDRVTERGGCSRITTTSRAGPGRHQHRQPTFLDRSSRQSGHAIREVANEKIQECRGTFPVISHQYHLISFAISTCGEIGQEAQRLIGTLAVAQAGECEIERMSGSGKLAVGRETCDHLVVAVVLSKLSDFVSHQGPHFCHQWVLTVTPTVKTATGSPGVVGATAGRPREDETATANSAEASAAARQAGEGKLATRRREGTDGVTNDTAAPLEDGARVRGVEASNNGRP